MKPISENVNDLVIATDIWRKIYIYNKNLYFQDVHDFIIRQIDIEIKENIIRFVYDSINNDSN